MGFAANVTIMPSGETLLGALMAVGESLRGGDSCSTVAGVTGTHGVEANSQGVAPYGKGSSPAPWAQLCSTADSNPSSVPNKPHDPGKVISLLRDSVSPSVKRG